METMLRNSWWMLALRGIAAVAFGVLALAWPGITLIVLAALFAAYALVTGVSSITAAIRHRKTEEGWWLVLALGIVALVAGILALFNFALAAFALVVVMGLNALFIGVLDIAIAIRLRRQVRHEWLLVLAGIVSILFGVAVLLNLGAGALALVFLVSFYALMNGFLLLALALRLRSSRGTPSAPSGNAGTAHAA